MMEVGKGGKHVLMYSTYDDPEDKTQKHVSAEFVTQPRPSYPTFPAPSSTLVYGTSPAWGIWNSKDKNPHLLFAVSLPRGPK
jgi:hypothetical protein